MNRTPLILAIVLLLLPVLYAGSYFALVVPQGIQRLPGPTQAFSNPVIFDNYRCGGIWSGRIFWPLEQIDRKVRPGAWGFDVQAISSGGYAMSGSG